MRVFSLPSKAVTVALALAAFSLAAPAGQLLARQQEQGSRASYNISSCPGYLPGNITEAANGFTMPLTLAGEPCNAYGFDIAELTLAVIYEKPHQLHVHIYDTAKIQYQQPLDLIFTRQGDDPASIVNGSTAEQSHFEFHHTAEAGASNSTAPWAFWITRKGSQGPPVFDTRSANIPTYTDGLGGRFVDSERNSTATPKHELIFENQYLQLSSALPEDADLRGLGQRVSSGPAGDAAWILPQDMLQPFFALDAGVPLESNMYGYHPVYLETRNVSNSLESHVVAFQNTAGMEVIRRQKLIQYRAIGGTLDFRFFSGSFGDVSSSANSTLTPDTDDLTAVQRRQIANMTTDGGAPASNSSSSSSSSSNAALVNSAVTAMSQYVQYIGMPALHPRYALGFHLLRWGYKTLDELKEVVTTMRANDIPLEVSWSDIDWLAAFRNVIPDPARYPAEELNAWIQEMRENNQHWIPIVDAAFPAAPTNESDVYAPGTAGSELDVWIKNANGSTYTGIVWPGYTYFPDQFATNVASWYTAMFRNLTELLGTGSGYWLDMNEASSFCVGSCGSGQNLSDSPAYAVPFTQAGWPEGYDNTTWGSSGNVTVNGTYTYSPTYQTALTLRSLEEDASSKQQLVARQAPVNTTDFHYSPADHLYLNASTRFLWDPPYAIHNGLDSGPLVDNLNKKTVSMEALTSAGPYYDVKNLDGTLEEMHVYKSLLEVNPTERPFLVSRSTAPGAGKYTAIWQGDNYATWQYLSKNIQGALQHQLFGLNFFGADTCGFARNTNEELCNRWMQLSAFMPFYRNHNVIGALPQEPWRWDSVANASRIAGYKRLEILPELYTTMARTSQTGTPALRSLWMDYPEHYELLKSRDTQYLFGSLLVTSVLMPNASEVQGFFPEDGGAWRNIFDFSAVNETNVNTTLPAPLSSINVHLRPRTIILTHAKPAYTTNETAQGPYGLYVNLGSNGTATGNAYVDDGITPPPLPSRELTFAASNGTLSGESTGDFDISVKLDQVLLMGLAVKPTSIEIGDLDLTDSSVYDERLQVLNVTGVQADLNGAWNLTWS